MWITTCIFHFNSCVALRTMPLLEAKPRCKCAIPLGSAHLPDMCWNRRGRDHCNVCQVSDSKVAPPVYVHCYVTMRLCHYYV